MAITLELEVIGRSDPPLTWSGGGSEISIGRSARCDLMLPDERVSGLHVTLRWDQERATYQARDEGSLNGTRFNERPLLGPGTPLTVGDRLEIGRIRLRMRGATQPTTLPTPKAPPVHPSLDLLERLGSADPGAAPDGHPSDRTMGDWALVGVAVLAGAAALGLLLQGLVGR